MSKIRYITRRLYIYRKGLYIVYRMKDTIWRNKHFDDELWKIRDEWWINFRFQKKWFDRESMYYDGHTYNSVTICGMEFGRGYSYNSDALATWSDD